MDWKAIETEHVFGRQQHLANYITSWWRENKNNYIYLKLDSSEIYANFSERLL